MPPPPSPPNPPPPIRAGGVVNQGPTGLLCNAQLHQLGPGYHRYPRPTDLGSHCKHVGVPTRLRIGNRLRRKCSAVAGGEGARTKGAVSKGTIFQCACKNAKPNIPQKWGCLLLGGGAWRPGGCIARSEYRPRRMYRAPPAGARQGSACGLAGACGSHWCESRG